jgi:hypothetical protein
MDERPAGQVRSARGHRVVLYLSVEGGVLPHGQPHRAAAWLTSVPGKHATPWLLRRRKPCAYVSSRPSDTQ